jgi:thiosulfate/3-mercaptopyruvate sulfurtransferase
MTEITTKQLIEKLGKQVVRILDIRPVDAFNGWTMMNEPRGGHIAGAKSLPYKWTRYMDWIEMVRHKEIRPEQEVIVYGYLKEEILEVSSLFKRSGFNRIEVYYHFLSEWCTDTSLPMVKLERYRHLVSAEWVHRLINGESPVHFDNDRFRIVHAHYRNRDAYLSGHIPGAIDMDTLAVEAPETWNRRSPEELKQAFEEHGISRDTTVILYGKFMHPDNHDPFPGSAAGDIGAIRIAFIMMYAGVKDVRVLNGGFQSWEDEGFEVSYVDEPKKLFVDFGPGVPLRPELAVDTQEAKKILLAEDAELVCVRSWREYIGEVSGYNYIVPKGRIPGAIFADCGSDAYHMENYRNFDHTTRDFNETADIWKKSGITPDKHLAFYCGTGWRGSEAWFNAWLMGWPRVSVYDGGWYEWSADPKNPFETGIPEQIAVPVN